MTPTPKPAPGDVAELLPCRLCGKVPIHDQWETDSAPFHNEAVYCPCGVKVSDPEDWNALHAALPSPAPVGEAGHPIIASIRAIAKEHGWAIGVHGSLVRDIDLIGVPWIAEACSAEALVEAIKDGIGYHTFGHDLGKPRGGGRRSVLLFARDVQRVETPGCDKGTWNPPAIDLSLMDPREAAHPAAPAPGGEADVAADVRDGLYSAIDQNLERIESLAAERDRLAADLDNVRASLGDGVDAQAKEIVRLRAELAKVRTVKLPPRLEIHWSECCHIPGEMGPYLLYDETVAALSSHGIGVQE